MSVMPRFGLGSFIPSATKALPGQYGACNGLRGLGAVAIACAHLEILTDFQLIPHVEYLAVVVDMFFIFSGLVMAHAYESKLSETGGVTEFLIRRFGRIWPLHAATLFILLAWEIVRWRAARSGIDLRTVPFAPDSLNPANAFIPNLLFLNAVGLTNHETWNFPSWSLGAEFCAYLVFAGLFVFKIGPRWLAACVISAVSLAALAIFAPRGLRSTYDFGAVRCVASFFLGMLIQNLIASGRLPRWPLPTFIEAGAFIGAFSLVIFCADTSAALLIPFILGGLVLVLAVERGKISHVLMTRPLQVLAEWSYSIYMIHALVLIGVLSSLHFYERHFGFSLFRPYLGPDDIHGAWNVSDTLIDLGHHKAAELAFTATYVALVVALSAVTYRFIEVPGRAIFNRFAKQYRSVRPARGKAQVTAET
jgi:peptidoglycan/LPS O-acetylase OafA/YrhL